MKRFLFFAMLILALCVATDVEAKKKKFKDGSVYEGEIVKGVIVGQGIMTYANGDVYNGGWKDGKQSGLGVMTDANGDKYNGVWREGLMFGQGVMTYANGDKYNGTWSRGNQSGAGVMTYANGDRYQGDWSYNKRHGYGQMYYTAKGDVYNGSWSFGVQQGKGVMTYANGEKYDGAWRNNKFNGQGTYTYLDKNKFSCVWVDGSPSNSGRMEYANGDIYIGDIKSMKRSGSGTFTANDSCVCKGEWIEDDFVNGTKTTTKSTGYIIPQGFESLIQTINNKKVTANEIKYSNNFSYKGDVDKFNREGDGLYYYKSEKECIIKLNGVWKDDYLVKGSGVITNGKMGDKFDIQSVGESKTEYKVVIYDDENIIYSNVLADSLNHLMSNTLCNIRNVIEVQRSIDYHDKYLKDKVFIQQMPINNHPLLKRIGIYLDATSLSLFEFILFIGSETMACKSIYVDTNRLRSYDRDYLTEQDMYARSIAARFNQNVRSRFTIEGDYIVIGEHKYRYIASENVLYDEMNKLKLKAIPLSELSQITNKVEDSALLGAVYGAESLAR